MLSAHVWIEIGNLIYLFRSLAVANLIFMFRKEKETGVKGHLLRSLLLQGLEIEASAEKRSEAAQHQGKQQEPADPGGGLAWGSVSSLLSITFIIPLYFPGC